MSEAQDADVLISIHNNALPDGVNPFTNNGTSVFYNHEQSLALARSVQRGLVQQLGLRDLGVGRGDLALVRPTWQPSILTEGLYMIVPEQEAALRSTEGQRRYAHGVFAGLQPELLLAEARPPIVNPAPPCTSLKSACAPPRHALFLPFTRATAPQAPSGRVAAVPATPGPSRLRAQAPADRLSLEAFRDSIGTTVDTIGLESLRTS